jgi:hypothetical protein
MTIYELQTLFSVDETYGCFGEMYYLQRRTKSSYFIMTGTRQTEVMAAKQDVGHESRKQTRYFRTQKRQVIKNPTSVTRHGICGP